MEVFLLIFFCLVGDLYNKGNEEIEYNFGQLEDEFMNMYSGDV